MVERAAKEETIPLPLRPEPVEAVSDLEAFEDMIFEAVERLQRIESLMRAGDEAEARRLAPALSGVARRLGLPALARVAGDLSSAPAGPASAAIAARLIRLGEESVAAVIAPGPRFR